MNRDNRNRGPIPLWQLALYIAVLGCISLFLAPLSSLWWIVPVLGAAIPVVLAVIQGREQRRVAPDDASIAPPVTGPGSADSLALPGPVENPVLQAGVAPGSGASDGAVQLAMPESSLSERELEVLSLLAAGKTNTEAAEALFISVGTVKSHSANIYRKLEARNRTEAVARARELGLLE